MNKIARARVPAGGELVLDQRTSHIMLFGLKAALAIGQQAPPSLRCSPAGTIMVAATVVADEP